MSEEIGYDWNERVKCFICGKELLPRWMVDYPQELRARIKINIEVSKLIMDEYICQSCFDKFKQHIRKVIIEEE